MSIKELFEECKILPCGGPKLYIIKPNKNFDTWSLSITRTIDRFKTRKELEAALKEDGLKHHTTGNMS